MSGHVIDQIKAKAAATAEQVVDGSMNANGCREQIGRNIEELHALSRRGLWGLLLFLSLSAVALVLGQMGAFAMVPVQIKALIGPPPPADLLHLAFAASWFSAFILILGRRGADGKPGYNWYNVGLPAAFYPLYVLCDPAGLHFPAVFAAGLVLLLLEHALVVSYTAKAIRQESARLDGSPDWRQGKRLHQ